MSRSTPEVELVGADEAAVVHAVVRAAFEARPPLEPAAAALAETAEQLERRLAAHGGLLARVDGVPAGALVLDPVGGTMYLRRFGVVPTMQGHGVAAALVDAAVDAAAGYDDLTVVAREELPETIRFWARQGFREVRRESPNVELRRPLRTAVFQAPDAAAMRGLGRSVAGQLAPGDLIVVTGSPGHGRTTFTQGLAAGLGTSLEQEVTVVEWGEEAVEGLSESRLEIDVVREAGGDEADGADERHRVEITPVGPRWHALSFRGLG
jgi:tRNA threonylcarbamoyladenosine biosynthesis protein TsaE